MFGWTSPLAAAAKARRQTRGQNGVLHEGWAVRARKLSLSTLNSSRLSTWQVIFLGFRCTWQLGSRAYPASSRCIQAGKGWIVHGVVPGTLVMTMHQQYEPPSWASFGDGYHYDAVQAFIKFVKKNANTLKPHILMMANWMNSELLLTGAAEGSNRIHKALNWSWTGLQQLVHCLVSYSNSLNNRLWKVQPFCLWEESTH